MSKFSYAYFYRRKVLLVVLVVSMLLNGIFLVLFLKTREHVRSVEGVATVRLLSDPLQFTGNKELVQKSIALPNHALDGKDALRITYNLHGVCLLDGYASALVFGSPI